jgi:hypothetical protein
MVNGERKMVNGALYLQFTVYHLALTIGLDDPQEMRHLRNDAAGRRRVGARHGLIQLRDPEASDYFLLLLRVADRAAIILDRDIAARVF